jgi:RNA polymerase sigma factor (TIGR02999 family)
MPTTDAVSGEITGLLRVHREGDRDAFDRLMPLVYEDLRVIARRQLRRMQRGQTMDTSALIRETYMQMVDERAVAWQDRGHFFAICARAMRRILVDAARRRQSLKRGGNVLVLTAEFDNLGGEDQLELVLSVDQALEQLAGFSSRLARVVECRFFAGMSEEETALALNTSLRGVQRDWLRARVWLQKALS